MAKLTTSATVASIALIIGLGFSESVSRLTTVAEPKPTAVQVEVAPDYEAEIYQLKQSIKSLQNDNNNLWTCIATRHAKYSEGEIEFPCVRAANEWNSY